MLVLETYEYVVIAIGITMFICEQVRRRKDSDKAIEEINKNRKK